MFKRLNVLAILIVAVFLLTTAIGSSLAFAATDDEPSRSASWHETSYQTDAWGRTWVVGQFGPDMGYGEQGSIYEYTDPMSGAYISYSSTGMGVGAGGMMAGYGGMFSPLAQASYGPYAGGQRPQVQSSWGYDTQGYLSGSAWGDNTSYYQAQPNFMAQMMLGGGGMFGGFFGGGYPGAYSGAYSGAYGGQSYGGFGGFSPFGGFGGFGGFGSFGGGYPTRIY